MRWMPDRLQHISTAWTPGSTEGHGVAILVRRDAFAIQKRVLHAFQSSDQERNLMMVHLKAQGGAGTLLVGTTHLESGAEAAAARRQQLREICQVMQDDEADCTLLAGDFNVRDEEDIADLANQAARKSYLPSKLCPR